MIKFFSNLLSIFCVCAATVFAQNPLPDPYDKVELLPFDGHGWFANASQLEVLIKTHNVKTVIEIGCWLGCSTRFIASLLPEGGKLYGVDHWLGSSEHQPGANAYHLALPVLYEQFLSNVIHAGLTDKIIPIRMPSLDAALYLTTLDTPIAPDLIYIDAGHETELVYADLNAWYPYVQEHGILCGDDWCWGSVQLAVTQFAQEHGLYIKASDNFWQLTKTQEVIKQQNPAKKNKVKIKSKKRQQLINLR